MSAAQNRRGGVPEVLGPQEFAAETGVSRETLALLKAYIGILSDWNARHNLVAASTMDDVWRRHVWDSAQLTPLIPSGADTLVDMGSGAGFPGMVLAVMLRDQIRVTLYEATKKKCAFLQAVAETLGLAVDVRNARIEQSVRQEFDVVTARACAPLDRLLTYAQHFVGLQTICLFLKGQSVESELTDAGKSWNMRTQQHPSLTDPSGTVLEIRELAHVVVRSAAHKPAHPGRGQSKGRRR